MVDLLQISILQLNVSISRKLQEKRPKLLFRANEQEVAYDFVYPVNKLSNFCSIQDAAFSHNIYVTDDRQTDQRQTDATLLIKRLLQLNNDAAYFPFVKSYTTNNLLYRPITNFSVFVSVTIVPGVTTLLNAFCRMYNPNSTTRICSRICCGFVVQQAVQQIHNKSATNRSPTTNPQHLDMQRCCGFVVDFQRCSQSQRAM